MKKKHIGIPVIVAFAALLAGRWIYDCSLTNAVKILKTTPTFTSLVAGPSRATIQGWAFGRVLRSADAASLCLEIFDEALPAGKMFALGGLHELSHESYGPLRKAFDTGNPTVTGLTGCSYSEGISAVDLLDALIGEDQFRLYKASAWPHRELCVFFDMPTPILDRLRNPLFVRLFQTRWIIQIDHQLSEGHSDA